MELSFMVSQVGHTPSLYLRAGFRLSVLIQLLVRAGSASDHTPVKLLEAPVKDHSGHTELLSLVLSTQPVWQMTPPPLRAKLCKYPESGLNLLYLLYL